MSPLTKILIVLLTLSSIFLCGIVVTYVGNADNYKEQYKSLKASRDSLSKKANSLTDQLNEKIEQKKQSEEKLNGEIASLGAEFSRLEGELKNAEREKAGLLLKVNSWASIVEDFSNTNDKQGQLLKNTLEELNKVQAQQIKERKELNETTAAFVEKMAIIETLESEKRRVLEEKSDLQKQLDELLGPFGKAAAPPTPVTVPKARVRPAEPAVKEIRLQGLVTAVDLKNSMASISIGKADGVREGMKFHVTRGDEFLCDILIIDVDAEESVGILELVQQQPRINDTVSTNL